MSTDIKLERVYPYTQERVWRALTDQKAMSEWLMANDFVPKVGHKFVFRAKPQPGWRGYVECEVLECEPPRKLSYSWVGNEGQKATTVSWTLHEAPGGTLLVLNHTGFEGIGGFVLAKLMLGPGWKKMMRMKIERVLPRLSATGFEAPPGGFLVNDCH
jgi:uncharacterized protein YndB with AHSA1/START domain